MTPPRTGQGASGPRLGRGLAALMGDRAASDPAPSEPGIRSLAIDLLEPGPFQPRMQMAEDTLADLVASIRARGILQPILVRPHPQAADRFQIIAGERRWRAAQQAGLHEIPALLRDFADGDAMAASLVENLQREDLDPIEEAEGYKRLLEEFGLTQERLGEAVGKSRSHVANALRLLNLPPSIRTEIQKGNITAGHARALLAHPEPEKALLAILSRGLNVRQAEALSSAARQEPGERKPAIARDPETEALERDLSDRLGLRVQISFDGKGGAVRIGYASLDQLDGLIALLTRGGS